MVPTTRIRLSSVHVNFLYQLGPGAVLAWHEPCDEVVAVGARGQTAEQMAAWTHTDVAEAIRRKADDGRVLDDTMMIIAGYPSIETLTQVPKANGDAPDFDDLAETYMAMAHEQLADWPDIRAMTPMVTHQRPLLAQHGIHLAGAPWPVGADAQTPGLGEEYHAPNGLRVRVSTVFAHRAPARIEVIDSGRRTCDIGIDVRAMAPARAAAILTAAITSATSA